MILVLSLWSSPDILDLLKYIGKSPSWGLSYTPIRPIGDTYVEEPGNKSGAFFIHGGLFPGSIGCIDLTLGNENFHYDFVQHNKEMILHVDYSKFK